MSIFPETMTVWAGILPLIGQETAIAHYSMVYMLLLSSWDLILNSIHFKSPNYSHSISQHGK